MRGERRSSVRMTFLTPSRSVPRGGEIGMDAPRFDFAEPEPTERRLRCPECRRNTLDRYADGVALCDGPGCTYHEDASPADAPRKSTENIGGFVDVAELREQIIPPLEEG